MTDLDGITKAIFGGTGRYDLEGASRLSGSFGKGSVLPSAF